MNSTASAIHLAHLDVTCLRARLGSYALPAYDREGAESCAGK